MPEKNVHSDGAQMLSIQRAQPQDLSACPISPAGQNTADTGRTLWLVHVGVNTAEHGA